MAILTPRAADVEAFGRRVAEYYDRAPRRAGGTRLIDRYRRFKRQNLRQYQRILDSGVTVRPWLGPGQPYRDSGELRAAVLTTGRLHVYLTSSGHGDGDTSPDHPLLEPTGIVVDGVEFCHNDVFRAVHDIFGHVASGSGFSARGEFLASFCHMRMYPADVHPVLFTEQVGQVCWYFFGPAAHNGDRRYPEQKVFEFPQVFLDEFINLLEQ